MRAMLASGLFDVRRPSLCGLLGGMVDGGAILAVMPLCVALTAMAVHLAVLAALLEDHLADAAVFPLWMVLVHSVNVLTLAHSTSISVGLYLL